MARVEFRRSGNHTYAVVVDDVWNPATGRQTKKYLQSFGNASNLENVRLANEFAAATNLAKAAKTARPTASDEDLKRVLAAIGFGIIAVAVLTALFGDE